MTVNAWTFWDLPGWREDDRLRSFYKHAFHPEVAYELDRYKAGANDGSEYSVRLRKSLEYLLEQQPATTKNWLALSGTQFYDEGELYGFLLQLYEYFYGSREHRPLPPDPSTWPNVVDE
ncbi:hypothetical protein [Kitasatospora sp. NPDC004531]